MDTKPLVWTPAAGTHGPCEMKRRRLDDLSERELTWAERERQEELRRQGVEDIYLEPREAPDEFWRSLVVATSWHVARWDADSVWTQWEREVQFALGWERFHTSAAVAYQELVGTGYFRKGIRTPRPVKIGERLAAIELLLDIGDGLVEFHKAANDRARHFRVGVRLENNRFVPVTSEHVHEETVQPTLLLLADRRFSAVDGLYRKAFNRALSDDASGAVTAAISAVGEMLRLGLDSDQARLQPLAQAARTADWIGPGLHQTIVKLDAFRDLSDAHTPGTDERDVAMLALHLTASILHHLGRTGPFAG